MIENVFGKGNTKSKEEDDYTIRIYVMFKYGPNANEIFAMLFLAYWQEIYIVRLMPHNLEP